IQHFQFWSLSLVFVNSCLAFGYSNIEYNTSCIAWFLSAACPLFFFLTEEHPSRTFKRCSAICLGTLVISTGFQAKISKLCWSRPHNLLRPPSVRVKPIITVYFGYFGFIATLTLSYNIGLVVGRVFSGPETEAHSSGTNLLLFRTNDLDAYDSECDDISSAKAVLMDNLSSYSSDVLYEKAQRIKPTLYNGILLSKKHDVIFVVDEEETLILVEESRSKMQ
nr:hypothetical protein [Tanacetum cinerariifolium]